MRAAGMLAIANRSGARRLHAHNPTKYELMLAHAAAHHLQRDEPARDAMSLEALHDYLDKTMDRIRGAGEASR